MTKSKNHSEDRDTVSQEKSADENSASVEVMTEGGSCGDTVDVFTAALSEKTEAIEKMSAEIESLKELMQRRQADFENYKKRAVKQQEDFKKFYLRDFALDIIAINDDLIRAYESSAGVSEGTEGSFKSFAEGVSMISKRIIETLSKYGIEVIEADKCEFDPNCHEAVEIEMNVDSDTDMVAHVYQKGFKIDDMVIRSCKVKVSKGAKKGAALNNVPDEEIVRDTAERD